ncbi:MAG: metallophosphoesterase [Planctomycetaceae bacterium]
MQLLIGWLILLLSIAGHTELWVLAVNRSHALPIRAYKLRKFRTLHDIAVGAFPFVLLFGTGIGETSLLRGGSWAQQPGWFQWILGFTIAGCIPLTIGILRWHFVRHGQFHRAEQREIVSAVAMKGEAARGRTRTLTKVWPWNEYCQIEVNRKRVALSPKRLRPKDSSDTVRILHLSDLHFIGCPGNDFYRSAVELALKQPVDLIVFTGDLIDEPSLLPDAIEILRPLTAHAPCVFILGNHDWRYEFEQIRAEVEKSGWKCVTDEPLLTTIRGHRLLIAGSEMPWMREHPPGAAESGCDLNLLLSHSPDQFRLARHLGYDLMLSGHTHGGQVVLPLIGPVYSPSLYGVSFVAGLFELGSLTLHVSRGLGAKDPLRWRCRPEMTILEVVIG